MKGITRSALPAFTAWSIAALAAPSAPPEFTHHRTDDWINSAPLTLAGLKGRSRHRPAARGERAVMGRSGKPAKPTPGI